MSRSLVHWGMLQMKRRLRHDLKGMWDMDVHKCRIGRETGGGKAHCSILMFMQIKICAFKCNNILTKLFAYYGDCRPWIFIISFY